jgi:hypothetical protein
MGPVTDNVGFYWIFSQRKALIINVILHIIVEHLPYITQAVKIWIFE